ncbi:MAG: 4-hydroxythreonine-4-phosphate dehydrogenase PdxA [Thioalkalispiraceae bacterium]|jgi:4-hydroxythreonine-4-phosphate dehydrogenase
MTHHAQLIVTPGEPAGIGPDLILQYAASGSSTKNLPPTIVVGDRNLLEQRAEHLGLSVKLDDFANYNHQDDHNNNRLYVKHVATAVPVSPGILEKENSIYVIRCLDLAVELCQKQSDDVYRALVTGPVHKGIINDAGIPFTGHTEYIAKLAKVETPVMMLATKGLRVALATTHLPLAKVSKEITKPLLTRILSILHADLVNKFAIPKPTIRVCGLNPHAGESGHLGKEEIEIIEPVLEELRRQGMNLIGPLPADTAFTQDKMQQTDAYLAMYHDQGLPVLKHVGFGQAVNITLGLPFIRTSVDHGTALELAGTGQADVTSLGLAMESARELISNRV